MWNIEDMWSHGVKVEYKKLAGAKELSALINIKGFREILGLIEYHRRYDYNYACTTTP